jgi:hypothetical protein
VQSFYILVLGSERTRLAGEPQGSPATQGQCPAGGMSEGAEFDTMRPVAWQPAPSPCRRIWFRPCHTTAARGRAVLPEDYGHVVEIMTTESTFSFGAFDVAVDDVELGLVAGPLIDAESSVPVISTLWPTWGEALLSSASNR